MGLTLGSCTAGRGVTVDCGTAQALLSPKYGTVAAETPYENCIKMCNVPEINRGRDSQEAVLITALM